MAGILVLLCEWVYEDIWHIFAYLAFGLWLPSIAMCIAFIFEGYHKYQKGSCVSGQQLLPPLTLPRLLFFPLWAVMWEVLAMSGWILWYYHGRWCEAFIPLFIWFGAFILTALWPIMMFVVGSFLLSMLVFVASTIWIIVLIGATVVFTFDVVAVLLQVIFLIWVAYNAVWTLIAWRNKGFRFPNPKEIVQDIYGVIIAGDASAPVPNLLNVHGEPWIPGDQPAAAAGGVGVGVYAQGGAGFAPSPCGAGFGGGPLATQCPKFVGTEMQQQQSGYAPPTRQPPGATQRFTGGDQDWEL